MADIYRRPIPADGTIQVAILLPLSGPSARLGKSMLNAAEMAMFEIANEKFALTPQDTKGTPDGAAEAARRAIIGGAQLILGPLLATSVQAVAPFAQAAKMNVVAFSNSRSVAGNGVYLMGFVPSQQVETIVSYASANGLNHYGVLAPRDPYGESVVESLQAAVPKSGGEIVATQFYSRSAADHSAEVKIIADYDRRRKDLLEQRAALERQGGEAARQALKKLEKRDTIGDVTYNAILLPETGQALRTLASLLSFYDVDPPAVRILGLRNWDEMPNPGAEPALVGAWFAAPTPVVRDQFVARYRKAFQTRPARLASLAYDATALAAILAQGAEGSDFSQEALTNPNGFIGVDGLFRLNPDGIAERVLAVIEVQRKGLKVLKEPAKTFQSLTN